MKTLFRQSHLVMALFLFMGMMVLLPEANATHFRFGHLTWQPKPSVSPNTVEFTLINAFRRDRPSYPGTAPDGYVAVGDVISEGVGLTRMRFGDGTQTPVLRYRVIAIDVANQWFLGVALQPFDDSKETIDHTYGSPDNNGNPWLAEMFGCCRISNSVNNPDGSYSVQTLVELVSGNRSPVSSLPPIVNLPQSTNASFLVPATDSDQNSTLSWRLATSTEAGGGGTFSQPVGLTVNSTTGLVEWNTTTALLNRFYSCQVIIEDRLNSSTGPIQTRVAVDFLIFIVHCDANNSTPAFVSPSPTCATTLNAFVGQPFSFTVTASDDDPTDVVTLNSAGIPSGATLTPGLPITGAAGDPVSSTFDWTPNFGDIGNYVVTFSASDNCGAQALCSYTIIVQEQEITTGNAFCTYTQGFYGNAGGTDCMGRTTEQVINNAIGAGITVGSTPDNTLDVPANGAQCVIDRLPGGGPSIAINGGPNDACGAMPGISTFNNGRMKNTLIGQALALSLNMGLNPGLGALAIEDGYDFFSTIEAEECFDPDSDPDPNGTSQDFYFPSSVASYLQSNYSADVAGLLALANDAISGVALSGSPPSLGDITAALGAINEGFDECRVMLGWDNDPVEKNADQRISGPRLYGMDVNVFPNPSSTEATFMFSVTEKGSVSLEIFNNVGARIEVLFSGELEANEVYSIAMPVEHLAAGIYHYRFTAGSESKSGSLVIAR